MGTASFISEAYGLIIQSPFPLLQDSVHAAQWFTSKPIDLVIRIGEEEDFKQPSDGFQVIQAEIPEFGQFLMHRGNELLIKPAEQQSVENLRAIILGSALAVILQQRDQLVLHASSVKINGMAVAFLGNSGWGKSTLVSSLHAQDYEFITDDVLSIDVNSQPPQVASSYPEVRLRPDTLENLGHTFDLIDSDLDSHWKQEKLVETRVVKGETPLLCLYILGVGDELSIEALPLQNAFLELSHHSRAIRVINSLDVPGIRAAHFKQCMKLVQSIPIFALKRRRSLAEMPQVVELIENHVAQLTQPSSNP